MITYQSLYQEAIETLRESGNPDAAFDARCLMEKAFGFDRIALSLHVKEQRGNRFNISLGYGVFWMNRFRSAQAY